MLRARAGPGPTGRPRQRALRARFGGAPTAEQHNRWQRGSCNYHHYSGEPPRSPAHTFTPTLLTTGSPLIEIHLGGWVLVQTLLQRARRGEFRRLAGGDLDRGPRRGGASLPGCAVADAELAETGKSDLAAGRQLVGDQIDRRLQRLPSLRSR